jgi:hypothetical protein
MCTKLLFLFVVISFFFYKVGQKLTLIFIDKKEKELHVENIRENIHPKPPLIKTRH